MRMNNENLLLKTFIYLTVSDLSWPVGSSLHEAGSFVVSSRLSCSSACGILLPNQGLNLLPTLLGNCEVDF